MDENFILKKYGSIVADNILNNELRVEASLKYFYKNYFLDFDKLKLHCDMFSDVAKRRGVFCKSFQ